MRMERRERRPALDCFPPCFSLSFVVVSIFFILSSQRIGMGEIREPFYCDRKPRDNAGEYWTGTG